MQFCWIQRCLLQLAQQNHSQRSLWKLKDHWSLMTFMHRQADERLCYEDRFLLLFHKTYFMKVRPHVGPLSKCNNLAWIRYLIPLTFHALLLVTDFKLFWEKCLTGIFCQFSLLLFLLWKYLFSIKMVSGFMKGVLVAVLNHLKYHVSSWR